MGFPFDAEQQAAIKSSNRKTGQRISTHEEERTSGDELGGFDMQPVEERGCVRGEGEARRDCAAKGRVCV